MTIRIAINGFGRIGRNVVRALYESGRRAEITVVAINELADAAGIAHLLKYDTSHGRFAWDVRQEREQLFVGDDAIRLLHEPTIAALPWRELAVDVVLDCTGVYGSREHGEAHLQAGAKKVLSLDDILTSPINGGCNETFGLLGSNKATETSVKLFPRDCGKFVEALAAEM